MTEERKKPVASTRKTRALADQQSIAWFHVCAFLIGLIFRFWIRGFRSFGAENVPRSGGVFVIANHTSGLDPFLIGYPVRQRHPVGPGKVELFRNPVISYVMRKIGIFPIRQETADPAGVRAMVELYRRGRVVIVYPEGGRSRDGLPRPFFPDFARLVVRLKAPLIAAAVAGAADALPVGARMPRRNTSVVVVYGKLFELSAFYDQQMTPERTAIATADLERRVSELREGAQRLRQGV